jgi:hypothetical protein
MTGMYQEIEDTTDVVNVAHDFAASMNWTATSFYALILLAIALAPTIAWAKKAWVPPGETKCHGFNFSGWSIDPDPKGLNVRAGPSIKAKILGTLPSYAFYGNERYVGPEFDIIGSKNGWLRIKNGRDYAALSYEFKPRKTYSGVGWIHGSRVRFAVQSGLGYQRPDKTSPQLLNISNDWLTDMGAITKVLACQGKWVLLDYKIERKRTETGELDEYSPAEQKKTRGRAWFLGVCPSQETTCDGVTPDTKP